ncbi:MAG: N-glycosylase/DNA lyase [Bacteroidota bacterium]|nr:N-glycosylase/DNA lyase [Bacteroidota bacterium]
MYLKSINKNLDPLSIADLKRKYSELKFKIQLRLDDFLKIKQSDYFYELVYCLLTPQSSARNADKAVKLLQSNKFHKQAINPQPILSHKKSYIRFHNNKSKYLLEVKNQFPLIEQQLQNGRSSIELRDWLVKSVKGFGYKEASHFLRNIGHRNLAILDRHILKNLVRVGVLNELPKSLSKNNYLEIEKIFKIFSKKINIPLDELDLLFWSMETGEILK